MSELATSLLKSIQLSFLNKTGQSFDINFYKDFYLKNLNQDYAKAIFKIAEGATKYQDPYTYAVLNEIIHDIINVIDQNVSAPIFGTANFDLFSAEIIGLSDEPPVILVSHGAFIFSDIISKIISNLILCDLKTNEKGICLNQKYIQFNLFHYEDITIHFCDIMLSYLLTGNVVNAKQYNVNADIKNLSSILNQIFITFIVAHEYSHYILGHTYDSSKCKTIDIESAVKQVYRDWLQEYQADLYGIYLCINIFANKGIQIEFIIMGVLLNFKTLEIIGMYNRIYPYLLKKDNIVLDNTHPPVEKRLQVIIDAIASEYKDIQFMRTIMDYIFNALWKNSVNVINQIIPDVSKDTFDFSNIQNVLYKFKSNNER